MDLQQQQQLQQRVNDAARAVVVAYRLAETLSDGWEEALRVAVDELAAALADIP